VRDVRSKQGAWGILSRDLLTRAMSFEAALIAAFAPFYNPKLYEVRTGSGSDRVRLVLAATEVGPCKFHY
jgi:hypothetical protein